MQSLFSSFVSKKEPVPAPADESEYDEESDEYSSGEESETEISVKKVLAGGDEQHHYEAPKPWTIRKPVYDKPLPLPERTPKLATMGIREDRLGRMASPVPSISSAGRRDRVERSTSPAILASIEKQDAHVVAIQPAKEEVFENVSLEPLPVKPEVLFEETPSIRAMDMYESRVADRHYSQEVELPTVTSSKPVEQYELDSTDQQWLYGSPGTKAQYGLLPSGYVKISENSKEPDDTGSSPVRPTSSQLPVSGYSPAPSESAASTISAPHAPGTSIFTLGDLDWKHEGPQHKRRASAGQMGQSQSKGKSLDTGTSIEKIPQLHSDMKSATVDSLNLALAEAGRSKKVMQKKEALKVEKETNGLDARLAGTFIESSAIMTSARYAVVGASISVMMTSAKYIRDLEARRKQVAEPKENFGRCLAELQYKVPVYDPSSDNADQRVKYDQVLRELEYKIPVYDEDRPDAKMEFKKVLAELRMTVHPVNPDQIEAHVGVKRGSFDDGHSGMIKKSAKNAESGSLHYMADADSVRDVGPFVLEEVVIIPTPTLSAAGETRKVAKSPGVAVILAEESRKFEKPSGSTGKNVKNNSQKSEGSSGVAAILPEETTKFDRASGGKKAGGSSKGSKDSEGRSGVSGVLAAESQKSGKDVSARKSKTGSDSKSSSGEMVGSKKLTDSTDDKTSTGKGYFALLGKGASETKGNDNTDTRTTDAAGTAGESKKKSRGDRKREAKARKKAEEEERARQEQLRLKEQNELDSALLSAGVPGMVKDLDEVKGKKGSASDGKGGPSATSSKGGSVVKTSKVTGDAKYVEAAGKAPLGSEKDSAQKTSNDDGVVGYVSIAKGKSKKEDRGTEVQGDKIKAKEAGFGENGTGRKGNEGGPSEGSSQGRDTQYQIGIVVEGPLSDANKNYDHKSAKRALEKWSEARYDQWMADASKKLTADATATPSGALIVSSLARGPSVSAQALNALAVQTLESIDVARTLYGDTDVTGRSYDWPFWGRLIEMIRQNPYSEQVQNMKPSIIEHIVNEKYHGVPDEARKVIWMYLSDNKIPNNMLQSDDADAPAGDKPLIHDIVLVDSERTFPKDEQFDENKVKLQAVLESYATLDPEVGYCSALALVAGILSLELSEEEAFTLFHRMMFHYELRRQYIPELDGLRLHTYQFAKLFERFRPELAAHLQEIGYPVEMVAGQWFATMFAYRTPIELDKKIYDLFILEGYAALFKFGLALFSENEAELMAARDKAEALDFTTHHLLDKHELDYKKWIEVAGRFDILDEYIKRMDEDFCGFSLQSKMLANADSLASARHENQLLSYQFRAFAAQLDAMMLDYEKSIREAGKMGMQIKELADKNYRLSKALYDERAERAKDMAVAELELQHLSALYEHRIQALEEKQCKCTCNLPKS